LRSPGRPFEFFEGRIGRQEDFAGKRCPQFGVLQPVLHRPLDLGQMQAGTAVGQVTVEFGEDLGSGGIHPVHRAHHQHHVVNLARLVQGLVQARFDRPEIAEEKAFIDAQEENAGERLHRVPFDVAEVLAAGNPADQRDMRRARPQQQGPHREDDAEPDADLEAEDQDAAGGAQPGEAIGTIVGPGLAQGTQVDHRVGRDDDGRRQHRQRHAREIVRRARHDGDHRERRNDAGKRRLGAGSDIHRRAREPAADRHAARESGDHIGGAQPAQLGVGIDPLAPFDRQACAMVMFCTMPISAISAAGTINACSVA
jgi:hypothetical protein